MFGSFMVLVVLGGPVVFLVAQKKGQRAFHRIMRFGLAAYLCWLTAFSAYLLIAEKKIPAGAWGFFGLWAVVAIIYLAVSPREERA